MWPSQSQSLDRRIGRALALQDPSGVNAGLTLDSLVVDSIADQAARLSELPMRIHRRNGVPRRQRHELCASVPAIEERVGFDGEPAGLQLNQGGEGGVDLALGPAFSTVSGIPFARAASS